MKVFYLFLVICLSYSLSVSAQEDANNDLSEYPTKGDKEIAISLGDLV